MTTLNVEYLVKNGPATASELPGNISVKNRQEGLTKFTLRGSSSTRMGGAITPVYYLPIHEEDDVLHAFLRANSQFVEYKTQSEFHRAVRSHGRSWVQAAHRVGVEYF